MAWFMTHGDQLEWLPRRPEQQPSASFPKWPLVVWVRSFRGPALDMYNVARGQVLRQLTPQGLQGDWWPTGTWSGNRFYLYAANKDSGRLWSVSPEKPSLDAGAAVAPLGHVAGCSDQSSKGIAAAAGNLFLYEEFGFKLDRRNPCRRKFRGTPGSSIPQRDSCSVKSRPICIFPHSCRTSRVPNCTVCPLKIQTGSFPPSWFGSIPATAEFYNPGDSIQVSGVLP